MGKEDLTQPINWLELTNEEIPSGWQIFSNAGEKMEIEFVKVIGEADNPIFTVIKFATNGSITINHEKAEVMMGSFTGDIKVTHNDTTVIEATNIVQQGGGTQIISVSGNSKVTNITQSNK